GMRIAMVFAMLGVLLAEMFAGNRGMGFQMQRLAMAFKAPELFAATAIVSTVSIAVVLFLEHLNRRLGRWRLGDGAQRPCERPDVTGLGPSRPTRTSAAV